MVRPNDADSISAHQPTINGSCSATGPLSAVRRASPSRSLPKHHFDAKPKRSDEAGYDNGDDRLESVTLRLLDTLSPTPQMLKICTQLLPILLFNAERGENRCNRPQ